MIFEPLSDVWKKVMKLPKEEQVIDLLLRLGATPNYTGFSYLVKAILLCIEEESRLLSITKILYPETAKYFSVSPFTVERDIRTLINVMWKQNRILLDKIAGYKLSRKPTVGQFLSIISFYISFHQQNMSEISIFS